MAKPRGQDIYATPPFLLKTYELVDDHSTNGIVSWSAEGNSFVVWRADEFSQSVLPRYFKHNKFPSFIRQLNTYGFKKVNSDTWEFAHKAGLFARGRRDLLEALKPRKPPPPQRSEPDSPVAVELGPYGSLSGELDSLRRDKKVLTLELVRLRQLLEGSERELRRLRASLELTEGRQQQMLTFLRSVVQNPGLMDHFFDTLPEATGCKRRRFAEAGDEGGHESPPQAAGEHTATVVGHFHWGPPGESPTAADGCFHGSELEEPPDTPPQLHQEARCAGLTHEPPRIWAEARPLILDGVVRTTGALPTAADAVTESLHPIAQDAPEACPLLSEAEMAMAGNLCSFDCADVPTARPMGAVAGLRGAVAGVRLPLIRPGAQLESPHVPAASMHVPIEGPHVTAVAPFAWMDEVIYALSTSGSPPSGSPPSVASADEARAGLPSQGSSPKLPFTFKATLHQQQPAEGPAEHCLHSDPELPVVKIDFKGAPAGVSLIEEAAGPATFAAEGQPGSRSGEQMLPQGLFIMANGQFSSLPCASDQGSQSRGKGHSCGAASQASGSAPSMHQGQDESRFVCEMMHLMNEAVAAVKQGEEPLDFCAPPALPAV